MMPLLAGLLSAVAYTAMQILFKRSRAFAASPLTLTAWLGLLAPLWLLLLGLGLNSHLLSFTYSHAYLGYTALWAAMAAITLAFMVALIQRLPLIQLTAYRKAFSAGLALLVDVLWLHIPFKPLTLLGVAVILGASFLLPTQSVEGKPLTSQTKAYGMLATLALAALLTGQLYAYRQALTLQPDVLSHVFFAKALMALFSLGLWALPSTRQAGQPASWPLMGSVVACFVVASVAEGIALQALPVTLVIVSTFVAAACFTVHDILNKELRLKPATIAALAAIVAGFVLLMAP